MYAGYDWLVAPEGGQKREREGEGPVPAGWIETSRWQPNPDCQTEFEVDQKLKLMVRI